MDSTQLDSSQLSSLLLSFLFLSVLYFPYTLTSHHGEKILKFFQLFMDCGDQGEPFLQGNLTSRYEALKGQCKTSVLLQVPDCISSFQKKSAGEVRHCSRKPFRQLSRRTRGFGLERRLVLLTQL